MFVACTTNPPDVGGDVVGVGVEAATGDGVEARTGDGVEARTGVGVEARTGAGVGVGHPTYLGSRSFRSKQAYAPLGNLVA